MRSIIDLARNLDLHVVAEGVEDAVTMDMLRASAATWCRATTSSGPSPPISSTCGSKHDPVAQIAAPAWALAEATIATAIPAVPVAWSRTA